ncbi:hypothetical protein CCHL11_04579 [Colletotrichum chlorophyti]|uniref:Rhodopsin domain-containing protein n=1 Tax=Colletotrichum chlorophyti TaxID=708187 RepID=A0A1Q8RRC9_9PEZI|nr:hypothetical protein CCHL11_04579 [Colletotrichum chlorophyti]
MSNPPKWSAEWRAQNKGPAIITVCWVFTILSGFFVFIRILLRWKIIGKFYTDDYFVILGLICGIISTSLSTLAVVSGIGRHIELLTLEQQQDAQLWTTVAQCPGILSFGLPKLAVVVLLIRLLNPGTFHKWLMWWMGIWCQLTLFVTVGLLIGRCTPAKSLWDFSIEGKCFDPSILINFSIYAGTFSAFVDVYLAVYPAVVLWRLQMSFRKKLGSSCALGIGTIEDYSCKFPSPTLAALKTFLNNLADYADETPDLVVWTVVEGSTIIIASSIPVMYPLLDLVLHRNPFASVRCSKATGNSREDSSTPNKSWPSRRTSRGDYDHKLGQFKPKSKARDDLGFTIVEDDSQENILASQNQEVEHLGSASMNNHSSRAEDGKILRTDVVTISYQRKSKEQMALPSNSWRSM